MTKKTIQETLFDITPEIEALAQMTIENNAIDKDLYAKYDVKRGLRDQNGKGVLTGLTHISDVCAKKLVDGVEVPAQTNQYTKQVEDDTNFIIEIKYGNLMESKSFPINFVYPSYIGLVKDIPTESQWVETLNKLDHVLNDSKSHDYTYSNHDSLHVCYAYPSSYGRLVSIEDDSFDYLDDFKYDKIEIEFNGKMIEYNVYIDKIPADVTNYTLKFR